MEQSSVMEPRAQSDQLVLDAVLRFVTREISETEFRDTLVVLWQQIDSAVLARVLATVAEFDPRDVGEDVLRADLRVMLEQICNSGRSLELPARDSSRVRREGSSRSSAQTLYFA